MKKVNFLATALVALGMASCTNNTPSTNTSNNPETIQALAAPTLESLKQNSDIVWIGEVYVDYGLNYDKYASCPAEKEKMEALGVKGTNVFKILKYQIADAEANDNDEHVLINKLIKNIESVACYKDEQLTMKFSAEESRKNIESVDTIIVFDTKTMKELSQVVVNLVDPRDVKFFRLKQLIYYNKKEITFKTVPLAIAPMVANYDRTGVLKETKALFWMKPDFIEALPALASEDITWAKRLYRNFPISDIKVLKEDYPFAKVIDTMMFDLRANAKTVFVGTVFDADGTGKMSVEELNVLGTSIDTIITFDPVTFQEKKTVMVNGFEGGAIEQLRLMQDFVWNAKTNQLSIRYVGFKPIISRYDDKGNFLNSGPMFTLKVGDNIK